MIFVSITTAIVIAVSIHVRVVYLVKELTNYNAGTNIPTELSTDTKEKIPVEEIEIKNSQSLDMGDNKFLQEKISRGEIRQIDATGDS